MDKEEYSDFKYISNEEKVFHTNKLWIPFMHDNWKRKIDIKRDMKLNFDDFFKFIKEKWIVKL